MVAPSVSNKDNRNSNHKDMAWHFHGSQKNTITNNCTVLSPLPPIIVPCRLRYNKLEDDLTDPYSYPHLLMFTSHVAPTACHLCECSRTLHALEGPLSTVSPHVVREVVCIARCVWAEVTVERLPPHADRASSRSTFSNALDDTMPVWPGLICLLGNIEKN